jgi:hypothetical protein
MRKGKLAHSLRFVFPKMIALCYFGNDEGIGSDVVA